MAALLTQIKIIKFNSVSMFLLLKLIPRACCKFLLVAIQILNGTQIMSLFTDALSRQWQIFKWTFSFLPLECLILIHRQLTFIEPMVAKLMRSLISRFMAPLSQVILLLQLWVIPFDPFAMQNSQLGVLTSRSRFSFQEMIVSLLLSEINHQSSFNHTKIMSVARTRLF